MRLFGYRDTARLGHAPGILLRCAMILTLPIVIFLLFSGVATQRGMEFAEPDSGTGVFALSRTLTEQSSVPKCGDTPAAGTLAAKNVANVDAGPAQRVLPEIPQPADPSEFTLSETCRSMVDFATAARFNPAPMLLGQLFGVNSNSGRLSRLRPQSWVIPMLLLLLLLLPRTVGKWRIYAMSWRVSTILQRVPPVRAGPLC